MVDPGTKDHRDVLSLADDEKVKHVHRKYLTQDESPADIEARKREVALVRKLDTFIAPVMMLLMLISYLDRGNIGFAATQGMTEDINLKGTELNTAVSVFYIFYILAEFPTSIVVKRLQFNRVIPAITFCWGLVCMCTGFVQSFGGLVTTRIFLGFFEGCLFPSMTLFLCNWYTREELGIRVAYLFIASALSGAFGGLIALGVLYMDGVNGWAGWRWLYIIEGSVTIAWAFCCMFLVPKSYETAYFLNADEKAIMRLRAERAEAYSGGSGHVSKADIKEAAKDVKSWVHGCIQIAVVTILYGFGTFLPIIIRYGFKFSTQQAQYLVVPVNLWGALVYAVGAYLSDRYQSRFWPMMLCAPIGIAGYGVFPLHREQYHVAVGQQRPGREARRIHGHFAHADEHRRCGQRADLLHRCGAEVCARACVESGVSDLRLLWMVGCEGHLQEKGEGEGCDVSGGLCQARGEDVYRSRARFQVSDLAAVVSLAGMYSRVQD
ncbi:hypothetical protein PMIN07_004399 [Paraphaeosphaeria minitans]